MFNRKQKTVLSNQHPAQGTILLSVIASFYGLITLLAFSSPALSMTEMKTDIPELCYQCHADMKKNLSRSYVHEPFKQGKCTACHNSHTSNIKGLMKEEMNTLCLRCHEGLRKLLADSAVHGAIRNGACTDCHFAHAGDEKGLLVKKEKDLCWGCHEPVREQLKKPRVHQPFSEGKCSSCHNPHASAEDYQLRSAANSLCKNCHEPRCSVGSVSITHATKSLNCITCHSGHYAAEKGLLGPYGHSLFLSKSCDACHQAFEPNKPVKTNMPGPELCFGCHDRDPDKFREDDVHWNVGDNPCVICHAYHASKKPKYTVNERGVCLTCHDTIRKKIDVMKKSFRKRKGSAVKDSRCMECHKPLHSRQPYYFRLEIIETCAACHTAEHSSTHPVGKGVVDPRDGSMVTCVSCHSIHSPGADQLLKFDKKMQLCIQCHKNK